MKFNRLLIKSGRLQVCLKKGKKHAKIQFKPSSGLALKHV